MAIIADVSGATAVKVGVVVEAMSAATVVGGCTHLVIQVHVIQAIWQCHAFISHLQYKEIVLFIRKLKYKKFDQTPCSSACNLALALLACLDLTAGVACHLLL